tara:strand:+ start:154 stop:447 length:294 start_codon:yes stop_codon:yes gene_type:complete
LDWLQILEQYGIPIVVAIAFGFFIWKQNKYIQDDLSKDIHQKFDRLEGIIIKLIDQQKRNQISLNAIEKCLKILTNLLNSIFETIREMFVNIFNKKK